MTTTDDARRVLRALSGAFPTYPVTDDTVSVYLQAFQNQMGDPAILWAVTSDWITAEDHYPRVTELLERYQGEARRRTMRHAAIGAGQQNPIDGLTACPTCGDSGLKWTSWSVPHGPFVQPGSLYEGVMPCPDCRPEEHAYVAGGHRSTEHDVAHCEHPWCKERAVYYARKGARRR